jgi:hypothetical protein
VNAVVAAEPKDTLDAPSLKPEPVMVMSVPPPVGPCPGLTADTVGDATPPLMVWTITDPRDVEPTAQQVNDVAQATA